MKFCLILFAALTLGLSFLSADVNVLILGSDTPGDRPYASRLSGSPPETPAFQYQAMADELRQILEGAGLGAVNVTTRNRVAGSTSTSTTNPACNNLASWFYWRYGEWVGNDPVKGSYTSVTGTDATRWAELRGENGTVWDYVVLIGDPYTIETIPGYYTFGVSKVAKEVAQGTGEPVLLMPWPAAGSASNLDHYKEVVYRTGRTAGVPVAPAGLAWQAAGSPTGGTHPSDDGAYIAAATLYSRLFGQSAANSTYNPQPTLAATADTTVTSNQGAPQYSGSFEFNNPFKMLGDKRRHHYNSNRGTSTENRIRRHLNDDTLPDMKITRDWTRGSYNSNTPDDDGLGWPTNWPPTAYNWGRHRASAGDGSSKSYFTNRNFWQLGFGFPYHTTTDPTKFVGQISTRNLSLAYLMKEGTTSYFSYNLSAYDQQEEIATARLIPLHTLWAVINREYPALSHKADQSHYNRALGKSGATFMAAIYSGRTPVQDEPQSSIYVSDPLLNNFAQRVGYETAWILGNVQARAPGLKVTPSSTNTSAASELFGVRFFFPPQEDVTVNVSVSDPSLAEVSHETLVFTPENYAIPQVVSSRALNNNSALSGDYDVLFTTASDDEVYDNLNDEWAFNMPANAAPSIDITTPSEGQNFPVSTDLTVSVNSSDPDGSVANVTLWINDTLVRQINAAPHQWSPADGDSVLASLDEDTYALRLRAVDNQGASYEVTRNITVGDPASNPLPAPGGLDATPAFSLVTLNWNASSQGQFASYSVYRSTTPGSFDEPIATGLTDSTFADGDVVNDTTYFYVVTTTDIFGNESIFSGQEAATPGSIDPGDGGARFGSDHDGFGGFTTSPTGGTETWSLAADSAKYAFGVLDVNEQHVASLLKSFTLDRSDGTTYTIQGVVNLTDGYGDDNNRIGILLFNDNATQTSGGGGLYLRLNTDGANLSIMSGISGAELASANATGGFSSDSWIGTTVAFQANITFTGADIDVAFAFTDQNGDLTTLSATVSAADYPGTHFGFATKWRQRGTNSSNRNVPAELDYISFGVTDPNAETPDSNNNGIPDDWETDNLGGLLGESELIDESGVPYYFLYLHGTNLSDPADRSRLLGVEPQAAFPGAVFTWEVLEPFTLGVDYDIRISTDLTQWDPLPAGDYTLETTTFGDRTRHELTLTQDYGERVFLRLMKP